jgi:hypothetical protein
MSSKEVQPVPRTRKPTKEFCIARLVGNVGLVNVGVKPDLKGANAHIKLLAVSEREKYVVYRQIDGRVLARAGRKSRRK